MNRGLIAKTFHETWPLTLVLGTALALVKALLGYVLPTFHDEIAGLWARVAILRDFLKALLGAELGASIGPHVFEALSWVHPVVLAVIWAFQLTFCSRVPVGEIDRGTVDVLLGLPVSRWDVYLGESLVFVAAGVVLFAMGLAGEYAGGWIAAVDSVPAVERLLPILLNGFCLYLAVGGVNYLVSSLSDRRGRAVGWGLGVVLASFLLNFLAQFWAPARSADFLSLLYYYRPVVVLESGAWPLADSAILLAVGVMFWFAAGLIFARRDISTV